MPRLQNRKRCIYIREPLKTQITKNKSQIRANNQNTNDQNKAKTVFV
jgi:hypothetical protein